MDFVTGGAFHGKGDWVYSHYKINHTDEVVCYNGNNSDVTYHEIKNLPDRQLCIINGLEMIIKRFFLNAEGRADFQQLLNDWQQWERLRDKRTLVVIGTDIGKGIVPINKVDRQWRDLVGWCYQDIVKQSNNVYRIWYGISEQLKKMGE